MADTSPTGILSGEFGVVTTADTNSTDNGRLYLWDGFTYTFMVDISGTQGVKGDTGAQGAQGLQGVQGVQGAKGDTGAAGADGHTPTKNVDYFDGAKGDTGAQGLKGDTGSQGVQGIPGVNGTTPVKGVDYFDGATGATGPQGVQGLKGDAGVAGVQGSQGIKGDTGATGATGPQGVQGVKGDSYSINSITITANTSIDTSSNVFISNGVNLTHTLPLASNFVNKEFTMVNINPTPCTLIGTVQGDINPKVYQYETFTIFCDGSSFYLKY